MHDVIDPVILTRLHDTAAGGLLLLYQIERNRDDRLTP